MKEKEMSFWEHLEEFRWTLIRIIIVIVVATIIGLILIPKIFDSIILAPCSSNFVLYRFFEKLSNYFPFLSNYYSSSFHVKILNINMATQFMTYMSASLAFGFIFSIPYILYELWKFISPALYEKETKGVKKAFLLGGVLFLIGCLLGYFIIFPLIFRFLITFKLSSNIENMISLDSYMRNFYTLILLMGIVFELPLLFWLLSNMGLITRSFFKKYRRYAIVVSLVLAALITPSGDPFSLFVVSIPLYFLWEFSALLVKKDNFEQDILTL